MVNLKTEIPADELAESLEQIGCDVEDLVEVLRTRILDGKLPAGARLNEVHLADDGEHGLEVLDDLDPDVIITDINMPRLDGFGFINAIRLRDDTRTIPILVLTTESSADLKAKARDAGATGWIVKPFAQDKLVRALRMVAG